MSVPEVLHAPIFTFLGTWNDFMGPLLYITSSSKYTLAIGLANFRGVLYTRWDLLMAFATTMTLPVLIVFFLAQRYFVEGVVMTGLKG